jgi:hypothetical protein
MVIAPIHAVQIDGFCIRFFGSPAAVPDMPWHAASDIWRAQGCTEEWTTRIVNKLRSLPLPDLVNRLETESGPEVIAPHFIALQAYDALIARGMAFESHKEIYTTAAHEAAFMQAAKRKFGPLVSAVAKMICGSMNAEASYNEIALGKKSFSKTGRVALVGR